MLHAWKLFSAPLCSSAVLCMPTETRDSCSKFHVVMITNFWLKTAFSYYSIHNLWDWSCTVCLKRAIVCLSCYTTHQDQKTWSLKFSLVCCVNLAHFLPSLVPGSFVGLCPRTWDPGNEFDCLMKKRKKKKQTKKQTTTDVFPFVYRDKVVVELLEPRDLRFV